MNEKGEVTTNTNVIGRIIMNYYQELYPNKLSNLEDMMPSWKPINYQD